MTLTLILIRHVFRLDLSYNKGSKYAEVMGPTQRVYLGIGEMFQVQNEFTGVLT